jgi:hypothetical protein
MAVQSPRRGAYSAVTRLLPALLARSGVAGKCMHAYGGSRMTWPVVGVAFRSEGCLRHADYKQTDFG